MQYRAFRGAGDAMSLTIQARSYLGRGVVSGGGDTTQTVLVTQRFASSSGTTAISVGVPLIPTDSYTSVSNCSLWIGGTEVACYIEAQTGVQSNGNPMSLLLQFDQTLTNGTPGSATLKFTTAPNVGRLTKRTVTWNAITNPDNDSIYAANIRATVPTNMQGVAMRPSSEFTKWHGFPMPLVSWAAIAPSSDETAAKANADTAFPYIYGGRYMGDLRYDQYGGVLSHIAWAAMLGDITLMWEAVTVYAAKRVGYFASNEFSDTDSIGSFTWVGAAEQYWSASTGAMGYLMFGDEYGRDTVTINYARARCFGLNLNSTQKYHYQHVQTKSSTLYNPRQVAVGLSYAAWSCKVGAKDTVYNGQTALYWTQQMAGFVVAHDAWQTMGTGQRFQDSLQTYLGSPTQVCSEPWKSSVMIQEFMHIHTHPLFTPITGGSTKIKALVDYHQSLTRVQDYDANNNPTTGSTRISPPYFDEPVDDYNYAMTSVDQSGMFVAPLAWAGNTYGGSYTTHSNAINNVIGDATNGPWLSNLNSPTVYKNFNETFAYWPYQLGWRYGGWV